MLVNFYVDTFHRLIYHQLCKRDATNVILFQIKVSARNIKESTLRRYFIKVTARPSFTR